MLNKNEVYIADFTGYTSEGLAVAHIEGQAVFVPNALKGEQAQVKILRVTPTIAYGKVETLLKSSPNRTDPGCAVYGKCGGCAFRHMDYAEELRAKSERVRDALTRIGGWDPGEVKIHGAAQPDGYRNKALYPVAEVDGQPDAGFFRQRSHDLIPITRCRLQSEQADTIRGAVIQWMRECHVPAYDDHGGGCVRHIFVRSGFQTGEILVCIVVNGKSVPASDRLTAYLRAAVPEITGVVLCFNSRMGNAIMGDKFKTIYGSDTIDDVLCGLRFRLSPRSFYQVNRDQAETLYGLAIDAADLHGTETVLDLYCGTGTITLAMASRAKTVVGVELIASAIADAKENARENGIDNASFFCADASAAAQKFRADGSRPDVVTVDPPRKGLAPEVVDAIAAMQPARVVYVSCDPATLARDVKRFTALGYAPQSAEAVDLFPRCAHVETVVQLIKTAAGD
ncbi:MAG: 23S rRNA (uracil(1939)-C(5))-methyltransferase RlmD [Oscillospiraceae bacterium]|nr:23S rRNA (uracil(1939)-C(5))-methyltransferase RlmD [Oscillospiraceae bacterium]